jgi:hypothetical protein
MNEMLRNLLGSKPPDPSIGEMFASRGADGAFIVLKVLAVDPVAIHVRIYSNRYDEIPAAPPRDLELLGLGPDLAARVRRGERIDAPGRLGIGHLPLSRNAFHEMRGRLIGVVPVRAEEMEGYEVWRQAGGGIWS